MLPHFGERIRCVGGAELHEVAAYQHRVRQDGNETY
jgi:hypothetical protein